MAKNKTTLVRSNTDSWSEWPDTTMTEAIDEITKRLHAPGTISTASYEVMEVSVKRRRKIHMVVVVDPVDEA